MLFPSCPHLEVCTEDKSHQCTMYVSLKNKKMLAFILKSCKSADFIQCSIALWNVADFHYYRKVRMVWEESAFILAKPRLRGQVATFGRMGAPWFT